MEAIIRAKELLSWVGPIVSLAFAILLAYGMFKWGKRLGFAFLEMGKNPFSFVFMLLVIMIVMLAYLKYIHPLLT